MPIVLDDKYTIHKKLGEGGFCKVYEARDSNGGVFAVKTWKEMNQKMFEDEKKACEMGEHPHLVKYIDAKLNAKLEDTDSGKKDSVAYILMEYVDGGEFLQTLIDHSGFNEDICRYYFKQIIQGIAFLHHSGLAHRDLKPDNMMLTKDEYNIKITDFGFLIPLEGRAREGWLTSKVGTSSYMAPEILALQEYHGKAVDIYSLGIILFIMRFGNMPMEIANSTNRFYKLIRDNRPEKFWEAHIDHAGIEVSKEFIALINGMIHPDPEVRLDLADVLVSPWMQGRYADRDEVLQEMATREAATKAQEEANRQRKQRNSNKVRRDFELGGVTYMEEFENENQANDPKCQLVEMEAGELDSKAQRQLISIAPHAVFQDIINYLEEEGVPASQIQLLDNKLKLDIEVSRVVGAAEKEDEDEDDYGDEEEKDEKKEGEQLKDLTEKMRFSLEIRKDGQDESKSYLVSKRIQGDMIFYRDVWRKMTENIKLLE